ncbi:MAG TPA: TOBE domain-containing protein, partial [Abditibacteriaceae bacterium]
HVARQDEAGWKEGQNVWLSIRPESLRVAEADNDSSTANRLAARVEGVMYLGENEQLSLTLSGGVGEASGNEAWRRVKVSITNPRHEPPAPGRAIELLCDAEDIVVLAD